MEDSVCELSPLGPTNERSFITVTVLQPAPKGKGKDFPLQSRCGPEGG